MIESDYKTADMINAAQQLDHGESKGQLIEMPASTMIAPTSSAVFAEPVIVAQPMQRSQRRVIPEFLQRMKVMAQMAGEDYRYSFPVKSKDGGRKTIEGGTIKMANDLVREYGNCMVDVRVIEQGDSHVFYARFVDYETGFCLTRPFRQRKGQKTMKTDEGRQEDIVFQIGASKAIRNVVLNALGTFADFAYEEARNSLVEKIGKDLNGWRGKIATGCQQRNYDLKRIEQSVGKPVGEWLAVDISRVVAELKSVADGMATFDDLYPVGGNSVDDLNKEFIRPGEQQGAATTAATNLLNTDGKANQSATSAAPVSNLQSTPAAVAGESGAAPVSAAISETAGRASDLAHDPETGELLPQGPIDPSGFNLTTQSGAKMAVKAICTVLEKTPIDERGSVFVALRGPEVLDVLGRHGIGSEANKFAKLGINIKGVPDAQ